MKLRSERLFGLLAAVWSMRMVHLAVAVHEGTTSGWLMAMAALWALASGYLLSGRLVPAASVLVIALILAEYLIRQSLMLDGLALLFWIAVIMAMTEHRQNERALLLRVCVTVVYAFAALSKLNPSWLAGDGLVRLAESRPQLDPLVDHFASSAGIVLAGLVVAVEGWLAFGLWCRRTRLASAAIGVAFHLLVASASISTVTGLSHLVVLNFGLVVMYPAFWHPVRRRPVVDPHTQPPHGS